MSAPENDLIPLFACVDHLTTSHLPPEPPDLFFQASSSFSTPAHPAFALGELDLHISRMSCHRVEEAEGVKSYTISNLQRFQVDVEVREKGGYGVHYADGERLNVRLCHDDGTLVEGGGDMLIQGSTMATISNGMTTFDLKLGKNGISRKYKGRFGFRLRFEWADAPDIHTLSEPFRGVTKLRAASPTPTSPLEHALLGRSLPSSPLSGVTKPRAQSLPLAASTVLAHRIRSESDGTGPKVPRTDSTLSTNSSVSMRSSDSLQSMSPTGGDAACGEFDAMSTLMSETLHEDIVNDLTNDPF